MKLLSGVLLSAALLSNAPAIGQSKITDQQPKQISQPTEQASAADIVIVQLTPDADQDKFDDLLKETHGKLIKTITAGPSLKFLVVQAQPGRLGEIEKRLSTSKEVSLFRRNSTCRINDVVSSSNQENFNGISASGHGLSYARGFGHGARQSRSSKGIIPSDKFFFAEWDLTFMSYIPARALGLVNNTTINFYFLDTGYAPSVDSPLAVAQYNFADPLNPTGAREPAFDSGYHGTATATVTASTDNRIGFAGMANFEGNRCILSECRISSDGETAGYLNILAALSSLAQAQGLTPGPINLSFNSSAPNTLNADPMIQAVAKQLSQKGFLLVIAAGNDGVLDPSPEKYARRVGAIDMTGNLASFSESGNFPAVAPGLSVPIYTPLGPTRQTLGSGTSFAAPRWCAAIAQVMGVVSPANRTAVFADSVLLRTGTENPQGYIIPNLQAALQFAAGN
jgi:protein required for attachment to host cells